MTSHIVGYPTGPILQATGNHLTTLPPTLLGGQQVLPILENKIVIMNSSNELKDRNVIFKLPGVGLALWVLPCPILGFIACVLLSVVYNFEGSTRTHCGVSVDIQNL